VYSQNAAYLLNNPAELKTVAVTPVLKRPGLTWLIVDQFHIFHFSQSCYV